MAAHDICAAVADIETDYYRETKELPEVVATLEELKGKVPGLNGVLNKAVKELSGLIQ